jgi:type III secretory pathway lipoprotein EscJ
MNFKIDLQSVKRRAASGLLLAAAVFLFSGCGKQSVANASSEFEANLMFDILHSNGFRVLRAEPTVDAEVKTWAITVDEGLFGDGEAATAIQVLRDYGLPRPPEPEIKETDSFGMVSERGEKERQRRDLQMQIERQLYTLPDVIRASVIITQPTDDILTLEKTPPSASVSLVLKETQPKFTIEAVQTLVSASVSAKLKPENVKVIISQQTLREIPLEKLAAQRRSNAIFAGGGGLVLMLALSLGGVLYMSKRRRKTGEDDEAERLGGGDETVDEFGGYKRPLLDGGNDDDDDDDENNTY